MTGRRWLDYLDHIIEAGKLIGTYLEGYEKADFIGDKRTQQAIIFNLIVIGEAATKLLNGHAEFVT